MQVSNCVEIKVVCHLKIRHEFVFIRYAQNDGDVFIFNENGKVDVAQVWRYSPFNTLCIVTLPHEKYLIKKINKNNKTKK